MKRIILACWLLLATGCGTMMQGEHGPVFYGGVQFDLYIFHETQKSALTSEFWFGILALLDIPFSFVLDTVLLPLTTLLTLIR